MPISSSSSSSRGRASDQRHWSARLTAGDAHAVDADHAASAWTRRKPPTDHPPLDRQL